jgi:hypothetical protein
MDQVSTQQRDAITRMSTSRLIAKLVHIGFSEEQLDNLDRAALLNAYAQVVAEGHDKPKGSQHYDPALEKLRLEFENKKFEEETRLKHRELERLERQEAIRQEEIALKQQELDLRREQLKLEQTRAADALIAQEELRLRNEQRDAAEQAYRGKTVVRAKMFGQAMQSILPKMSSDPVELIPFFETVEDLFHKFDIPDDLKATLLHPHLTEKARSLLSHLDTASRSDFALVKKCLLDQFHLTPQEYRFKFNNLIKQSNETYLLFANRLKLLLDYYVRSRGIDKHFDRLLSLLVSDRMKANLPSGCLQHILSIEANATDGWLEHTQLAQAVDAYFSTHLVDGRPRSSSAVTGTAIDSFSSEGKPRSNDASLTPSTPGARSLAFRKNQGDETNGLRKSSNKPCFVCGGPHLAANCDNDSADFRKAPMHRQASRLHLITHADRRAYSPARRTVTHRVP